MTEIPARATRNLRDVRGTRLIAALLGLSVLGSVAIAEPEIGSRIGDRIDTKRVVQNDRDLCILAHQLAGCILSKGVMRVPSTSKLATRMRRPSFVQRWAVTWNGEMVINSMENAACNFISVQQAVTHDKENKLFLINILLESHQLDLYFLSLQVLF